MAQIQGEEVLVRGSEEHQNYEKHQFGKIKAWVSAFETRIAVTGRTFLLIYVGYITIKAGAGTGIVHISLTGTVATIVSVVLFLLDIFMLALQVLGLEGSIPGLIHLADEMETKGKREEAEKIRRSADTAQMLMGATAIDVILQYAPHIFTVPTFGQVDISGLAFIVDKGLFFVRVVVISMYLKSMARIEQKGPKVVSRSEYDRMRHEEEQDAVRHDNLKIEEMIAARVAASLDQWHTTNDQGFVGRATDMTKRLKAEWRRSLDEMLDEAYKNAQGVAKSIDQAAVQAALHGEMEQRFTDMFKQIETMFQANVKQGARPVSPRREARNVSRPRNTSAGSTPEVTDAQVAEAYETALAVNEKCDHRAIAAMLGGAAESTVYRKLKQYLARKEAARETPNETPNETRKAETETA